MNLVQLSGTLGKDPEVRHTQDGKAVANVSVATRGFKKDDTDWHKVTAWGKTAEFLGEYFRKGDGIVLSGRIQYGSYEKDGVKHYTTEVVADRLEFPSGRRNKDGAGGKPSNSKPQGDEFFDDDLPF